MLLNWPPLVFVICSLFSCAYSKPHRWVEIANEQILTTKLHHRPCIYRNKGFWFEPLPSVGFASALIAGKGPGLSSSALLHSSCSKTQLKAAHHALRPKITLHVSHPEYYADSSSRRVPFCGKWPVCSYFWRNGKIFPSATRREVTLQKKLFSLTHFGFSGHDKAHNVALRETQWATCPNICISRLFIYSAS